MRDETISQFLRWNGKCPTAAGLLFKNESGNIELVAQNDALREIGAVSKDMLDMLKANENLKSVFETGVEATVERFSSKHGGYLKFLCHRIDSEFCELWISYDHEAEKSLLDQFPVGIVSYCVEKDGLYMTYVNKTALEINGPDMPIEKTASEFRQLSLHPDDVKKAEEVTERFLKGEESQFYEVRILRQDKSIRWIRGAISWLFPGRDFLTVYIDVTDMKNAELSEQHTRLLLEKILATTQTAIFWKDADRRFLGANKAFLDYYGFDSEDAIIGKTDEDMGWHTDPDPYKNDELMVIKSGMSTTRVPGMCISHGENRNIVASKSPMYENGRITGLVGSFEDVTNEVAQKSKIAELNISLATALRAAEEANSIRSDFLARMSHDMRTPLTTVIGLCDIAMLHYDDSELADCFKDIKESSKYLLMILSDILDMQKLSSGGIELSLSPCRFSSIDNTVSTIIRPQALRKNISFETSCVASDVYVKTDERRLEQVLINLLNNAVKYTQPGGTVRYESSFDEMGDESVIMRYVIADNGPGIGEDFLKKMYEPFTQENSGPDSEGSGLGLAIANRLVELLNGNIKCDTAPGRGTVFTIAVPGEKVQRSGEKATVCSEKAKRPAESRNILICEDNDINAKIIERLLRSSGMTSKRAENGEIGVRMASENRYDAILMDIRMPEMDGYEAARKIRAFDGKVPIIALSANSFPDDIAKSIACGMDAHVSKPIDIKLLIFTIERLIEEKE